MYFLTTGKAMRDRKLNKRLEKYFSFLFLPRWFRLKDERGKMLQKYARIYSKTMNASSVGCSSCEK